MSGTPLVSGIIVFLDEERFLDEAIESVFEQSYPAWELLLVDDGSTDRGTEIARDWAARHPERVRYLEHEGHQNRGMSASRNLGIREARGEYVAWLDGDDVWLPRKLEQQVEILERHPEAAMVYGPLHVWYGWTGRPADAVRDFVQPLGFSAGTLIEPPRLLTAFLRDDLHTPGGEMVRRAVLESVGGFDASFRGMYEDGVVHAKICLDHAVFASGTCWYRYRQHPDSCCNVSIAAGTDREARRRYLTWLDDHLEAEGRAGGEVGRLVRRLLRSTSPGPVARIRTRIGDAIHAGLRRARPTAERWTPAAARRAVGLVGFGGRGVPPSGWVHLGNLRRVTPISRVFGFDRGRPVDRHYIEGFLETHAADVRGAVLEVGDRAYTLRFGGDRIERSDVLHARPGNAGATIVGDLSTGEGIPEARYDCVILTQVLPFVWDFRAALAHARGALKPGGVLLLTVPGFSQISRYDAERWGDFWRFTSMSMERLFAEVFPDERVTIEVFGNVLAATAFLHGLAAEELSPEELDHRDPDFEVTIAVRAERGDPA
jgi:SAM-dependent methyltransferase